eukprot:2339884-Heterocapsa_arctica.AAC.1
MVRPVPLRWQVTPPFLVLPVSRPVCSSDDVHEERLAWVMRTVRLLPLRRQISPTPMSLVPQPECSSVGKRMLG